MHPPILGNHTAISRLRRALPGLGQDNHPLIIIGEAGVGKTLLACHIHGHSVWRDARCIILNAAMLDEHAQWTQLFGGEPPMLTTTRTGIIERSTTVVIKNAERLQPYLQTDLNRAMESGYTRRVGSKRKRKVLSRFIFTFRTSPLELGKQDLMVGPLLHRLRNLSVLQIPTLRSRQSDIPVLARFLTGRLKTMFPNAGTPLMHDSRSDSRLRPDLLRFLRKQEWPGNITQLRTFLRSLLVHSPAEALRSHEYQEVCMMLDSIEEGREFSLESSMRRIEQAIVSRAVKTTGGNVRRAGYLLGLSESTIHRRR